MENARNIRIQGSVPAGELPLSGVRDASVRT